MMQPNDYVTKAANYVKQAQAAEERNSLEEALGHYEQALLVIKAILQNKQCTYLGKSITHYAETCLARAEQIREAISNGEPLPITHQQQQQGNTEKARKVGGAQCEDEEKSAMMQQLGLTRMNPSDFNVAWADIIGMDSVKTLLSEAIRLPKEMPHIFTGNREPTRSVLLYGPPGTGKSMIGKAMACEAGVPFFAVSSAELISKYVGESEKQVKLLFEMVKGAKPCVLFLDEVDALCGDREASHSNSTKTVQQFLTQLDGMSNTGNMDGVFVLACTNLPWALDEAMRRRLEYRLYIGLPTLEERVQMLRHYVSKNEHCVTDAQFLEIAEKYTENFSASDIQKLCKKAATRATGLITSATHFLRLPEARFTPSDADNPNAVAMTYIQIKNKALIVPPSLSYDHIMEELRHTGSTVDVKKLTKYKEWAYGSTL